VAVADLLRSLALIGVEYDLPATVEPYVLEPYVGRSTERCPMRGYRVGRPSDVHRRAARDRDELNLPGLKRALGQSPEMSLFFREALLAREGELHLPEENLGDLRERLASGYGGEVGEPYALASCFHPSLVAAFSRAGEARLEEVVAYQSREARSVSSLSRLLTTFLTAAVRLS
jgi:hypothetical protein